VFAQIILLNSGARAGKTVNCCSSSGYGSVSCGFGSVAQEELSELGEMFSPLLDLGLELLNLSHSNGKS
jgi:hypothetical protein